MPCYLLIEMKWQSSYHSPPEGVRVAGKVGSSSVGPHCVFFAQIDEVGAEDEAEKADVQRSYQLL